MSVKAHYHTYMFNFKKNESLLNIAIKILQNIII